MYELVWRFAVGDLAFGWHERLGHATGVGVMGTDAFVYEASCRHLNLVQLSFLLRRDSQSQLAETHLNHGSPSLNSSFSVFGMGA